ncbi:MAG: zinc-dependent metalloprotease [Salinirussus sp.]
MSLFRSIRAVSGATGTGPVDWAAAAEAAKSAVDPGDLTVSDAERRAYSTDVREARRRVSAATSIDVELPDRVQIQHRHHWIDANIGTFERVLQPIAAEHDSIPGLARTANTGSMAVALGFLASHVLGQYDPLLLADRDDHGLYFVRPNIHRVADEIDVAVPRFRRWIVVHEVTHAAEFAAAPWLADHLENAVEDAVARLAAGGLDREALGELDTTMTTVEGYAELLMDRALDEDFRDVRAAVEARRQGRGPVARVIRRLLGLHVKRRQYERGRAFFETVADRRGLEAAARVWTSPETLPTDAELDDPAAWLARVG